MKQHYMKLMVILLVVLLCVLAKGCSATNKVNLEGASIAVIETATFKPVSYLKLYKADGSFLRQEMIRCQDINSTWTKPIQRASHIIMNTGGGYSNRSDKIVDLDLLDATYDLYPITTGILADEATGAFIYATDCPVPGSVIHKFDLKRKKISLQKQINGCISHFKIINDSLFAFADDAVPENENTLSIYRMDSESLEMQKTARLPRSYCVTDSVLIGSNMYFASSSVNIKGDAPDSIYRMDVKTLDITKIPLALKGPFCMTELKGRLYISSIDPERAADSIVSIFNTTLGAFEERSVRIQGLVTQIEAQGTLIYLYTGSELTILNATTLKTMNSIKLGVTREDYRNQGFFLLPKSSK